MKVGSTSAAPAKTDADTIVVGVFEGEEPAAAELVALVAVRRGPQVGGGGRADPR